MSDTPDELETARALHAHKDNPQQGRTLLDLLRVSTIERDARAQVDALIRQAVALGVTQTTVAIIAGVDQATVSRIVNAGSSSNTGSSRRRRLRRPRAGGRGGTV